MDLKITDAQRDFIPSVLHSIAESKFDPCTPMGIWLKDKPVGFLQYCIFNRICWVSRVLVDESYQRMGIGKEAVKQVLAQMGPRQCDEVRTSFHPENHAARALFASLGFVPHSKDEWEAVYKLP